MKNNWCNIKIEITSYKLENTEIHAVKLIVDELNEIIRSTYAPKYRYKQHSW